MINVVTIFIDGYLPLNSKIRESNLWLFKEKEIRPKGQENQKVLLHQRLNIYNSKNRLTDYNYYDHCKEALKELVNIQEIEANEIYFTFHYSYFYDTQCNIEFDREYIKLFQQLNCNVTIICAQDEEE